MFLLCFYVSLLGYLNLQLFCFPLLLFVFLTFIFSFFYIFGLAIFFFIHFYSVFVCFFSFSTFLLLRFVTLSLSKKPLSLSLNNSFVFSFVRLFQMYLISQCTHYNREQSTRKDFILAGVGTHLYCCLSKEFTYRPEWRQLRFRSHAFSQQTKY